MFRPTISIVKRDSRGIMRGSHLNEQVFSVSKNFKGSYLNMPTVTTPIRRA